MKGARIGTGGVRAMAMAVAVLHAAYGTPAGAQSADPAASQPVQTQPASPELLTMPIDVVRSRANANDILAMEELGRRLIQGTDTTKDPQSGAGWLLRAADAGSPQSQFNVGVMYERGFVVERDSGKAAEWYRKAAQAGLPVAKHNLALLLREGKGVPRDVKAAIDLLKEAAHQGTAASMFSLGDIYDRGDGGARNAVEAMAWFAVAAEFERQVASDTETPLAKTAGQRAQALHRTLTPEELARAQERAQGEFRLIIATLSPGRTPPGQGQAAPAAAPPPAAETAPAAPDSTLPNWPGAAEEQVRLVQQYLVELKYLRTKPDGSMGPMTRNAIREFQKYSGLKQTGEVSRELFLALTVASAPRPDVVANSPLPAPAPSPAPAPAPAPPPAPAPSAATSPTPSPPPPPPEPKPQPVAPADLVRTLPPADLPRLEATRPAAPKAEVPKPVDLGTPPPPPAPPTSAEIAKLTAPPPDPEAWPSGKAEQVKAVQALLRELKFYNSAVDGVASTGTRAAIRDYERMSGLKETGEPSKALFDSLKEMRNLMGSKR
jgi:peptidoglycan hydrolase-like protein with peptidoglycan-binding domain